MRRFNESFCAPIGRRIKKLRDKRKLSRDKFAAMADISDKFLYDIEVSNKGISADTLCRISDVLGVSADWLLRGKEFTKEP